MSFNNEQFYSLSPSDSAYHPLLMMHTYRRLSRWSTLTSQNTKNPPSQQDWDLQQNITLWNTNTQLKLVFFHLCNMTDTWKDKLKHWTEINDLLHKQTLLMLGDWGYEKGDEQHFHIELLIMEETQSKILYSSFITVTTCNTNCCNLSDFQITMWILIQPLVTL